MLNYSTVAIVGVGLIGGSIGLALRQRRLVERVIGVGRREERLRTALKRGAVDATTIDLEKGVAEAELIVVCTPVGSIANHVRRVMDACPTDAVITDAGSTKAEVVEGVGLGERRVGAAFVGSHPIAGDHRTGVEHARADLFEGRTVVVTLSDSAPEPAVERVSQFWQTLGGSVELMVPDEHDRLLAAASHAPHLVAASVAAATPLEALPLSGSGWQDVTRIAAGDPGLWREIVASNRRNIGRALAQVESALADIRQAVETGDDDRLQHLLTQAKRIRDAVGS